MRPHIYYRSGKWRVIHFGLDPVRDAYADHWVYTRNYYNYMKTFNERYR